VLGRVNSPSGNWLPRLALPQECLRTATAGVRDRHTADYATRHSRMVAREGSAPSTSGCRPDAILFHHRAFQIRNAEFGVRNENSKTVAAQSSTPHSALSTPHLNWLPGLESHQHSRLQRALSCDWTTRQENWWPARVTRPVPRIKSPLHHFNACRPWGIYDLRFMIYAVAGIWTRAINFCRGS
jgi:hypothetical protein